MAKARLYSWSKFAAKTFPQPLYIVDPLITQGSVNLLYGPSEGGKTSLSLTLFNDMETDRPWLGRFPTRDVPKVFLQVDMPEQSFQERVRRMTATGNELDNAWVVTISHPIDVTTVQESAEWVKRIRDLSPGLVVVDSLRKIHLFSEIDTNAPSRVYGRLQQLFPGAAIIVIGHTRQPGEFYDPATDFDDQRGTTAWKNDAHCCILAHLDPRTRERTLYIKRAQSTPEEILRTVVNYEIDTDSLLVRPTEGESVLDEAIIEALTNRELSQKQLVKEVQKRVGSVWDHTIRGRADQLVEAGVILDTGGGGRGRAHKYRLAEPAAEERRSSKTDAGIGRHTESSDGSEFGGSSAEPTVAAPEAAQANASGAITERSSAETSIYTEPTEPPILSESTDGDDESSAKLVENELVGMRVGHTQEDSTHEPADRSEKTGD